MASASKKKSSCSEIMTISINSIKNSINEIKCAKSESYLFAWCDTFFSRIGAKMCFLKQLHDQHLFPIKTISVSYLKHLFGIR